VVHHIFVLGLFEPHGQLSSEDGSVVLLEGRCAH